MMPAMAPGNCARCPLPQPFRSPPAAGPPWPSLLPDTRACQPLPNAKNHQTWVSSSQLLCSFACGTVRTRTFHATYRVLPAQHSPARRGPASAQMLGSQHCTEPGAPPTTTTHQHNHRDAPTPVPASSPAEHRPAPHQHQAQALASPDDVGQMMSKTPAAARLAGGVVAAQHSNMAEQQSGGGGGGPYSGGAQHHPDWGTAYSGWDGLSLLAHSSAAPSGGQQGGGPAGRAGERGWHTPCGRPRAHTVCGVRCVRVWRGATGGGGREQPLFLLSYAAARRLFCSPSAPATFPTGRPGFVFHPDDERCSGPVWQLRGVGAPFFFWSPSAFFPVLRWPRRAAQARESCPPLTGTGRGSAAAAAAPWRRASAG